MGIILNITVLAVLMAFLYFFKEKTRKIFQ